MVFGLVLEILLGLIFYMFVIRELEINNLNLEKNIKSEKILENSLFRNIENLKVKNLADQKIKFIFNQMIENLPAQENLEAVILDLSKRADIYGLKNFEIKWLGQHPQAGMEEASLSLKMTGSYLDFVNFYVQVILKKYPMVKIKKLDLSREKIQMDLDFIALPQISD